MGSKDITLGDVVTLSSGGTPSKKNPNFWSGRIPWVSAKSMDADRINKNVLYITESGLNSGSRLADAGSILLLTRGSGLFTRIPVIWVSSPVAFNQDIKCITAKDPTDARFIYHWLISMRGVFTKTLDVTGIGAGKINTDQLLSMRIYWPDTETRQRITCIADPITNRIHVNRRINDYLTELRDALVKSQISDALDEGRGAWQVVPLQEAANIQSGYSYKSAELVDGSTIGMLGIKNFDRSGSFRPDGFKSIKPERVKPSQYVNIGDIVVAHTDLTQNADIIGRAIQVIDDGGYKQMIESLDLVKVTSAREDVSNEFLAALLGTEDFHRHCLAYVNGTTVLHLGKKALPEYELKIPDDKQVMTRLDSLFKTIAGIQSELIRENRFLGQLRDTLLPKLMSGEIDVTQVELPMQPNNHLSAG